MMINATLFGQALFVFAVVVALLSYHLGKTRTTSPIAIAFVGFLSALLPPLALVYLIVLVRKDELVRQG